jgi:hypothetical protein
MPTKKKKVTKKKGSSTPERIPVTVQAFVTGPLVGVRVWAALKPKDYESIGGELTAVQPLQKGETMEEVVEEMIPTLTEQLTEVVNAAFLACGYPLAIEQ